MSHSVAVSVIVPVYNAQDYIAECIESVINQTLKDLELIIVDDGSDDRSWAIIQSYCEEHYRVTAFQQKRQRQGVARNLGLKHAKGEFVTFVDADDKIPAYAYLEMFQTARDNNSDMVVGILESFNERRKWHGVHLQKERFSNPHPETNVFKLPELLRDTSACNKIFKKSILDQYQIRFGTKKSGDDLFFTAKAYIHSHTVSVYPKVSYHYRATAGGSSTRISPEFFRDRSLTTLELKHYYQEHGGQDILPILMHVELRKLVTKRPKRVIENNLYSEQIEAFQYIQTLTSEFSNDDILQSEDLETPAKLRTLFIKSGCFDALIAWENNPWTMRFLPLVDNEQYKPIIEQLVSDVKAGRKNQKYRILAILRVARAIKKNRKNLSRLFRKGGFYLKVTTTYFFIYLLNPKSKKNVWLIDERVGQSAEDNSVHLFKYLRKQYSELRIYYVIRKNSPQKKNIINLGNVVDSYSLDHLKLLLQSEVLLSTDSFRGLALPFELVPWLRHETHNVFLQHGVSGNKTTTYFKKNHPNFSNVIVCSDNEKRLFVETYGFLDKEVNVTGFARFDQLSVQKNDPVTNKILIASTWRKWLRSGECLYASKYFDYWSQLLKSPRLSQLLEHFNATIYFQPHFNMMKFINEFEGISDRISIQAKDFPLQQHIKDCDLLITDYSSVMYDFYYQEKPVICYMFDRDEWEKQLDGPPLIDFDNDLPSDIVFSADAVVDSLEEYLDREFAMKEEHLPKIDYFFKYRDHGNCERIYQSASQAIEGAE